MSVPARSVDLATIVRLHAARDPMRVAVDDGSRAVSYADLATRSNRIANLAVARWRLKAGDRVIMLAPNCVEFVELILGLGAVGIACALANARQTLAEFQNVCESIDPRLCFVHPDYAGLVNPESLPGVPLVQLGGADWDEIVARGNPDPIASPAIASETAMLVAFTSGSTGSGKAAVLSVGSRIRMYRAMEAAFPCYQRRDRNLTVAPLYHGAGFNFCLATLFSGGSVRLMQRFEPEQLVQLLVSEQITNTSLVPTHLAALLSLDDSLKHTLRHAPLSAVMSNGAPLSSAQRATVAEVLDSAALYDVYGSTEVGIVSMLAPSEYRTRCGSVGRPLPEVKIELRDANGQESSGTDVGELWVSSPYLFSGYVADNATGPRTDVWFPTGDRATRDADNYLYLTGRAGEMIITGGLNVLPHEVEAVLASHPDVADVAVFGRPDPYWGEIVCAVVSPRPGRRLDAERLLIWSAATLARHKLPKRLAVLDVLPYTSIGKVDRRALRDRDTLWSSEGPDGGTNIRT